MTIIQAPTVNGESDANSPYYLKHWILPTKNTTKNTFHCTTTVGKTTMFLKVKYIPASLSFTSTGLCFMMVNFVWKQMHVNAKYLLPLEKAGELD